MDDVLVVGKVFNSVDFSEIEKFSEFEECEFINCDFTECILSEIHFIDCKFCNTDLSMIKVSNTLFRNVEFIDCKMQGITFCDCSENLLSFKFINCMLSFCSFNGLIAHETIFDRCKLDEVDFEHSELNDSEFIECDLDAAVFGFTRLDNVDFSSSYNFVIDPESNVITGAKFSAFGLIGLLQRYKIEVI